MHYYKFNIGDYSSHTSRLSLMEDLAYRRLIDLYYLNEKPFEGSIKNIAREIGMIEHTEEVEYVLHKFFSQEDECFYHKRIEKELAEYKGKKDKAKKAGKASGEARRKKSLQKKELNGRSTDVQLKTNGRSTDVRVEFNKNHENVEPTINHKPLTTNHKPIEDIDPNGSCEASFTLTEYKPPAFEYEIQEIFDYWCFIMKKNPKVAKLTKKRSDLIKARLKEGYEAEAIKQAIVNCSHIPHNMGDNENRKQYNGIELICRNAEKLEYFINPQVEYRSRPRTSLAGSSVNLDNVL